MLKSFVPLKRNIRNILPPFYISHSIHLFNKRTALRRYLRLPSDVNKQTYLDVLDKLSFSVDLDKIACVDKFSETNSSLYDCFKLLRSLSCDSDIPETMFRNIPYAPLSNSHAIANRFNTFFRSVFNEDDHLFDDFSENDVNEITLSLNDIELALSKASIGCGDDIPKVILRKCSTELSPIFMALFRHIFSSSTFPEPWKVARVVSIPKSSVKWKLNSYRPNSVLSKPSLVFERVLNNKLFPYVRNKVTSHQSGFLNKRSTDTQLLQYVHSLYQTTYNGKTACSLYLDFSNAFDKVSHTLLLYKLQSLGVGGSLLRLFHSYLSGRTQYVMVNGIKSGLVDIRSGVPQGSILGPNRSLFF